MAGDPNLLQMQTMRLPENTQAEIVSFFELVKDELQVSVWTSQERYLTMKKVRDQLRGGKCALDKVYHPDPYGLTKDQIEYIGRVRRHVNLVQPALNRFVNRIHSGRITRKLTTESPVISGIIKSGAHGIAMRRLCQNAYAFGTGYMVPHVAGGRARYWHLNPLWSVMVVDPMDVSRIIGVLEMIPDRTRTKVLGFRLVTDKGIGSYKYGDKGVAWQPHQLGFAPVVVAYGLDMRHEGEPYGATLVEAAADGSIDMTANRLNLLLLRDRHTQAILALLGEWDWQDAQSGAPQKVMVASSKDESEAKYVQPESRLADVISVGERLAVDAALSLDLPLDVFAPDKVTGSDASATAARARAFPLELNGVWLNEEWRAVELAAIGALFSSFEPMKVIGSASLEEAAERAGASVSIIMATPDAEAEKLAGWIQKMGAFLVPAEEAIRYYSPDASDQDVAALAVAWRMKNDPTFARGEVFQYHVEGGVLTINEVRKRLGLQPTEWGEQTLPQMAEGGVGAKADEQALAWKRNLVQALFQDPTTGDVAANLTELKVLLGEAGLRTVADNVYVEPYLPVQTSSGELVSGDVIKDPSGDVVGGAVIPMQEIKAQAPDAGGKEESNGGA